VSRWNGTGEVVIRFVTPPKNTKPESGEYTTLIGASDYSGKSTDKLEQTLPMTAALEVILHLGSGGELFTGMAPGPDLRVPLPFMLHRQRGTAVHFSTLFVPQDILSGSGKTSFEEAPDGSIVVHAPGFTDTFMPGDRLSYRRESLAAK
jgi:hypothetical protein